MPVYGNNEEVFRDEKSSDFGLITNDLNRNCHPLKSSGGLLKTYERYVPSRFN
jgi:hypothetical protein